MGYQPLEKLLIYSNFSVYKLAKLAAKRAMELADGSPRLVESTPASKLTTIALDEIASGQVMIREVFDSLASQRKKSSTTVNIEKENLEQEQRV